MKSTLSLGPCLLLILAAVSKASAFPFLNSLSNQYSQQASYPDRSGVRLGNGDWREAQLRQAMCILEHCVNLHGSLRSMCVRHTCSAENTMDIDLYNHHRPAPTQQRFGAEDEDDDVEDYVDDDVAAAAEVERERDERRHQRYRRPTASYHRFRLLDDDLADADDDVQDADDDMMDEEEKQGKNDDDDVMMLNSRRDKRWQTPPVPLQMCSVQHCSGQRGVEFYMCMYKKCIMNDPASAAVAMSSNPAPLL